MLNILLAAIMNKRIILRRFIHRDKQRLALVFDFDREISEVVKRIPGIIWSQTTKCWYTDDNEESLKSIIAFCKDQFQLDISAIVSSSEFPALTAPVNNPGPEPEPESASDRQSGNEAINSDFPKTITEIIPSEEFPEKQPVTKKRWNMFGPVQFTINEEDGRLAVKFLGKYDQEWISEMKTFGRLYFDKVRKDWLIPWSQLNVDSLSDYFNSRHVEVIIRKNTVPVEIRALRIEEGSGIRERRISDKAREGIDKVRDYLNERRYSPNTLDSYLSMLELFFGYYNDRDPLSLTKKDITLFFNEYVLRLGYSASYQNQMISAIKTYFTLCGKARVNPDLLERPRRSRALPKVFSKDEVMKIFSATRNGKHKLILWLIYSCGLRRSEVINLRLTDLDAERGLMHIREGKGKVDRIVPVPAKVWEKIKGYVASYRPRVYLFEGQGGGKYSVESVYNVFKQSLRRAGIKKDVGVHSLRHSYATHLHENGLDIRYIQELLGHKSSRTTEIYTHVSRRDLFAVRSPIEDIDIG